jgi:tetratricopeptide (TPR) repeat protein
MVKPASTAPHRGGRCARLRPLALLRPLFTALVWLVWPSFGVVIAQAQDPVSPASASLSLPLRLVDGHLLLSATVYDQGGADDAITLELALDSPAAITLHGDQLGWLKLDESKIRKNQHPPVKVVFAGGTTLQLPASDFKPEGSSARIDRHNRLTQLFPSQLDERKVKGTVGLGFLRNYHVTVDLVGRVLTLAPSIADPTAPLTESAAVQGFDFSGPFELRDGRLTLPVHVPGPRPSGLLVLGSSFYDTLIDQDLAKALDRPTGDVEPVTLLGETPIELSRYVAFRPKAWRATPIAAGDERVFLSGVNLLAAFRLEIDWTASQLHLTQQADPARPEADRAYFHAEAAGTAGAFEEFLKAFPESRMSNEAARKLMALRIDDFAPADEDLLGALDWVLKTTLPERRTETGLTYVARFAATPGQTGLAIRAGQLSLSHSRTAMTVQDVYRLHRVLGELYLEQGELDSAWKHLLSAAFVPIARDPEHAFRVALNLARVYEKQGRAARAYSRYKAALAVPGAPVTPDLRKEITEALARLKTGIPSDTLKLLDS